MGCVLVEMYTGLRLFDFSNDTRRFAGIYAILSQVEPVVICDTIKKTIQDYIDARMNTPKDQKLIK